MILLMLYSVLPRCSLVKVRLKHLVGLVIPVPMMGGSLWSPQCVTLRCFLIEVNSLLQFVLNLLSISPFFLNFLACRLLDPIQHRLSWRENLVGRTWSLLSEPYRSVNHRAAVD
jgi:hypothetical protein